MHRRIALLLALALLTAAPGGASPLDRLWSLLTSLWGQPAALDEGCGWDPDGVFRCQPASLDEGCGWDPSGQPRCQSAALKEGIGWDPNGGSSAHPAPRPKAGIGWDPSGEPGKRARPRPKAGCGWDPNGRCIPPAQP